MIQSFKLKPLKQYISITFIFICLLTFAGYKLQQDTSQKVVSKIPENAMHYELIIIGSGPAGYTAALYASRAGIQPLVITGNQPGGQLTTTTDVENYPGFPDGVLGSEMMDIFQKQAERFNTVVEYKHVTKVNLDHRPFSLICDDDSTYTANSIIISTGASAKWLGLPTEKEFNGFGVSACATCDGFFYKGKDVLVVGGGDTAMEEALYLSRLCNKVYLAHRRDTFRASKIMQDRVKKTDKIEILWNSELQEILGEREPRKKVTGARIYNNQTQTTKDIHLQGVFIAIGHKPNSDLFKGIIDMDETGYIQLKDRSSKTNIPGVFVAGDVCDKTYRQAVTSAGMGCIAALDAERYLESLK